MVTSTKAYVFQCSSETYLGCMEHGLFGSNVDWPLSVKRGDYCILHHYDAGTLLGLWRAVSDGGRDLVRKAWNGKFPYQVKVALESPKVIEVPRPLVAELGGDPAIGRFDSVVEETLAGKIVEAMKEKK